MEKIKNLLSGHSKSSETSHEQTDVGNSGSSAITGGSSRPDVERRADPTTETSQSGLERRADPTTATSQYNTERRADPTTESGSYSTGQSGIGGLNTSTGTYGTGVTGSSNEYNTQSSQHGTGILGSSANDYSNQSNQRGTGLSETSTNETGRNLLTGAGIVDGPVGGTSESTNQGTGSVSREPIAHSGTQHGSGRELGSSAAAGVTPGFANNAHERSFPLSGNTATTSNTTSEHHIGRDATALGSAGVIGEGIHHHRDNEREIGSNTSSGHHIGRDTAALGSAGVIGEGIHHHRENERELGSNTSGLTGEGISDVGRASASPKYGVAGQHTTMTANLLDPNTRGGVGHEDHVHHHQKHGGGAEEADKDHTPQLSSTKGTLTREDALQSTNPNAIGVDEFQPTAGRSGFTTESSTHHLGRDAAIVSGVGGAAYTAEHAHKQPHIEKEVRQEHHHEREPAHDSSNTTRHTALSNTDAGGAYVTDKYTHTQHDAADSTLPSGKKDVGDMFHGEDRNRGVVGSSGFPGESGFGDGTTHVQRDWRDTVRQAQKDYGITPDSKSLPTRSREESIPRSHNTTTATTGHEHSSQLDANGTPRTHAASDAIGGNTGSRNY